MAIDSKIVALVHQRANGYCEKCGGNADDGMALHHRKLKSRGGKDSVANLIWVHHKCHNTGTDSIHLNPAEAEHKGWMVGSWQDPDETPIYLPDGSIVLLNEDGTIHHLGDKSGEE